MRCPRCQQENPPQAKFCLACGAPLILNCESCGTALPGGARFCLQCGRPVPVPSTDNARFPSPETYTPKHLAEKILTSKSALEGERKQVTVLFADLKGSMELLADRDPEDARKLLDPVLERMMEAVHRYEGTVNQVMGDGIMALFGAPVAHEDHAVRACYAALRMQEAVKRYAEAVHRSEGIPLQIRVGVNSGEVVVRAIGSDLHMDYTAVGQTTHLAARLEHMAMPGSILLSAVSAVVVSRWYLGDQPLFRVPALAGVQPTDMLVYAAIGVLSGLGAVAYVRLLLWLKTHGDRWTTTLGRLTLPGLAGLCVGLATVAYQGEGLTLQPCSVPAVTDLLTVLKPAEAPLRSPIACHSPRTRDVLLSIGPCAETPSNPTSWRTSSATFLCLELGDASLHQPLYQCRR